MKRGEVAACLVTLTVMATTPVAAATLHCPPRLPGPHPGFEQIGPVPAAHWLLWRMRLFNVPPGKDTPTELLPAPPSVRRGGFTLTWHLTGTEGLLMACLYNGSGTYYRARLQSPPTDCTMQNDDGLTQAWCEAP